MASRSGPPPIVFGVAVTDFKAFAKDIKAADKKLATNLRQRLKKGADLVADQAKANAAWSQRIPGSIKSSSSPSSAKIIIRAPNAAPFENMGKAGNFRHPVFGNRQAWVTQKARPFALPALVAKADEVAELVGKALDDFARDAGFR